MSEIVTDRPDPDCPHCHGRGTVGGCSPWRDCTHTHTYSFCRCVNERTGFADHKGLTLEEAVIDTDEPDVPPEGWHICDCSDDCGAWEPDVEVTDDE